MAWSCGGEAVLASHRIAPVDKRQTLRDVLPLEQMSPAAELTATRCMLFVIRGGAMRQFVETHEPCNDAG